MTDRAAENESATVVTAQGRNGAVMFDGKLVRITRSNLRARLSVGKGEKSIPTRSITAVQWKAPGAMVAGFIEFSLGGGNEVKSAFGHQTTDAAGNENAVVFSKKQAPAFAALRAAVEAAIAG